jgi:hypothetical protein
VSAFFEHLSMVDDSPSAGLLANDSGDLEELLDLLAAVPARA